MTHPICHVRSQHQANVMNQCILITLLTTQVVININISSHTFFLHPNGLFYESHPMLKIIRCANNHWNTARLGLPVKIPPQGNLKKTQNPKNKIKPKFFHTLQFTLWTEGHFLGYQGRKYILVAFSFPQFIPTAVYGHESYLARALLITQSSSHLCKEISI